MLTSVLSSVLFKFAVIGLACFFLAWMNRRIWETKFPSLACAGEPYPTTMSKWWNKDILYAVPVLLGVIITVSLHWTTFLPEDFRPALPAIILGICLGFLSSFLYKIVKHLFLKEAGVTSEADLPNADMPTPPK